MRRERGAAGVRLRAVAPLAECVSEPARAGPSISGGETVRWAWLTSNETGCAAWGAVTAELPLPTQTALSSPLECRVQLSHIAAVERTVRAAALASARWLEGAGWLSNAHCSSQSAPWQLVATNTRTTAHATQRRKLHMSRLYSILLRAVNHSVRPQSAGEPRSRNGRARKKNKKAREGFPPRAFFAFESAF